MNFLNLHHLPWLLIAFVLLMLMVVLLEHRYFKTIKTYWFYRRSLTSYLASLLFLLGFGGLLFSLLDLRGPEERVKARVPEDRTIILLDTSASMLAEDVKPSRLQKASLIAKHFARKAVGHQISIVAFSETQKKIVPFTADLDLIDARLDSLKNLKNQYGASGLSTAILESIRYFRENGGEMRGNLLVLTDGEETSEGLKLKVPKGVNVALVGIGTRKGGRIPLDDSRGFRFGYKKHKGQDIITKLEESFFKNSVTEIPSAKHWFANSYSLPSEEILEFFGSAKMEGLQERDMLIRPVRMEWVVVPALLCLALSFILKSFRTFSFPVLLLICSVAGAQPQTKEEIELSPEVVRKLEYLQAGKLNRLERIKLADDLAKSGLKEEGIKLYQENLRHDDVEGGIPEEAYLNYGTALLESGDLQRGLETYKKLSESLDSSEQSRRLQELMDKNVSSLFARRAQQQKKKKEQQDQQKNNQDQQDKSQAPSDSKQDPQSEPTERQDKNQQKNLGEDKKDSKDTPDKSEEKNKKEGKDKKEDKSKSQDEKDPKDEESDAKEDRPQEKKRQPKTKLPAKLKQLLSDDRQLQMKIIENGTRELNRKSSRDSKDW